jgi:hypothetical protein
VSHLLLPPVPASLMTDADRIDSVFSKERHCDH